MEENKTILTNFLPRAHALEFVGAMATVGVWEELFFRGFLMTRLRRATGGWIAGVLLSSGVFVALHALTQAPAALIMIAILSLIFSLVTIWRRSLVPAIVAHTLFDLTQVAGLYYIAGDEWR
jgi:membrane protease YdiL (CAAX protease family)